MRRDLGWVVLLICLLAFGRLGVAQGKKAKAEPRTTPLTVTGRALDEEGKTIEGATIFLVSTNTSPEKLLGQTKSDKDGRFEFREAPLQEGRASKSGVYQSGTFQVFGKAPGRAFAWRGMKFYYADPKLADAHGFQAGDKIEQDLTFAPPQRVSGQLMDENGKPVGGVKLHLGRCDYANTTGKEEHVNFREFWSAYQAAEVMPEQFITTSDADGKFELASVPPGVIFHLGISHPDYARMSVYSATTPEHRETYQDQPIVDLPLDVTLHSVRTISVLVVAGDTGQPMSGISVSGLQNRASGPYAFGKSDKDGKLQLKLPPGQYKLQGSPPRTTDFVKTVEDLVVEQAPAEQSARLRIDRGCVLILKAIDVDTGAGIREVSFWQELTDGRRGRRSVQSHTTMVDNPKSNAQGELRVVVEPGVRSFGVGFNPLPDGYDAVNAADRMPGRRIDLPAGETVTEEFLLRKAK